MTKKIFIIAAEASGDIHGSELAKALKQSDKFNKIYSAGGALLAQNSEQKVDLVKDAVMGIVEVLSNIKKIKLLFEKTYAAIEEINPDVIIFIDSPEFNLRMAKKVDKTDRKLVYFISPKFWAWREHRVKIVKKHIDKMLVIFPFEVDFYAKHGMEAFYVGHPLVNKCTPYKIQRENELPHSYKKILLLPGSRQKEIEYNLAQILTSAEKIRTRIQDVSFILVKHPNLPWESFEQAKKSKSEIDIIETLEPYEHYIKADCAIACSGTVTYELAILGIPTVVVYNLSPITHFIFKSLVKIKYASMLNIIMGKEIFPELLYKKATPENIESHIVRMLENVECKNTMKNELLNFFSKLKAFDSQKAAELILS